MTRTYEVHFRSFRTDGHNLFQDLVHSTCRNDPMFYILSTVRSTSFTYMH